MRATLRLLLRVAALWTASAAARAAEVDVLQILSAPAAAAPSLLFVVTRATFGAPLLQSSSLTHGALSIAYGSVADGCSTVTPLSGSGTMSPLASTALLLDRGGSCSFVDKAIAAQNAGASLVIVRDTILGAYASAAQRGAQAYDCDLGMGSVTSNASFPLISASPRMSWPEHVDACTSAPTCATKTCVLTGAYDPLPLNNSSSIRRYQVCCFASPMVQMNEDGRAGSAASRVRIPAVFLSFQDAETLTQHLMTATSTGAVFAHAFRMNESPWDASMLLSWLLGVCVVLGAAYHSYYAERSFSYENVALSLANALGKADAAQGERGSGYVHIGDDGHEERQYAGDEARYELSGVHALYFLLGASSVLLLLFYVNLALVVNVLFAVGASVAMADVLVLPLLTPCFSPTASSKVRAASSYAVAALIALGWFLERASASVWPLQDLLGICLCFAFIDTVRIPSLRVATLLLSVACVYDVFFVYVSPFVFGSNIMVDVATGAGSSSTHHTQRLTAEDNIVIHHDDYQGDVMPMVLRIPFVSLGLQYGVEKGGGYALLGLGDLLLPGLLLSFCIRYDYYMGYPLSRAYFCVAGTVYALALAFANAMAVVLRDVVAGQPALMYIVPMMLAAVLGLAYSSNELTSMWRGPPCLLMANAGRMPVNSEGEKQPLVIRSVK